MKKIYPLLVGGMLALGAICASTGAMMLTASADENKAIDIYVIAGQSNAAGCATISSLSANRKKSEYTSGFEDIYFYGKVDADESLNANGPFNTFDKVVKFGQGFDDDRFGAEIGLADVISQSGTENESLIVKYASGSLNITSNWCPPSKNNGTGGTWYEGCMDTIQTAVTHYTDLGYEVNLKGTFWMQGEAESENGNGALYETYLTALIGDMREDYVEIFDETAESAPFVIGKVAPTYNWGVAHQTEVVRSAQDSVASKLDNTYTVETKTYTIVNPETGLREPGCVDNWHFNGNDMLSLGIQVGNKILYPNNKKTIAMYLIAGQSNASGYSLVNQVAESEREKYADGFKDVYYYGRADFAYYKDFNQRVKFGLGRSDSQFGAEVGIADIHTKAFPNQEAIIVKYAMGSTYLVDTVNNVTNQHGNWCSPSMPRTQANLSGKLYDAFIDYIEEAVDYYWGLGYEIDLKGTFWMQGEAEADGSYASGDYKSHLKALINDLRDDYAKILDNEIAKQSPFVIGKICPTFAGANDDNGVGAVRRIQDAVADEMNRVYLVETKDYPMVDPETGAHRGPDYYHFEGNDMLSLGRDVGDAIVKAGKAHVYIKVNGRGTMDTPAYVFLEGQPQTITFTATKERYILKSVLYDGVDVTAQVVNGVFTVTDTEGQHNLEATFEKEPKYMVLVEANEDMVLVDREPLAGGHYVGEKVIITVKANTGYEIVSVKWNGEDVALTDNSFEITVIEGENKVSVEAKSDGTVIESNRPQKGESNNGDGGDSTISDSSESGCSGSITYVPIVLVCVALVFIVLLRRKRNKCDNK